MDTEDIRKMHKLLQRAGEAASMHNDGPSVRHMSFIPQVQRSNMLLMTSQPPQMENMVTVFIGTIRPNYTEEMWKIDVQKWQAQLGNQSYYYIGLLPLPESPDQLNTSDAIPKIERALDDINQLTPGAKLRVIVLGTGHAGFLYEALTFLLREWKEPNGSLRKGKYMQFITSGDTKDRNISDFCQWLCISGVCENIEFYNTMKYHPFGYCSSEYSK
jgi:hypothetical protein